MPTALVTGASRGLGAVFADRLAQRGFDLVLVARDRAGLERTAETARSRGVIADVLVADLSDPAARATVEHRLADPHRLVDMLVNNAGFEVSDEFVNSELRDLQAQIDTNISAVMSLTHSALPGMIARGSGSVINVASFAGYLPSPGSTYASTKAWVLAFTDTMSASLTGTGVGMIALCPGRMLTGKHKAPDSPSPLWLEPAEVVEQCLRDLAKGRTLCTPGWIYRTVVGTLEMPRRSLRAAAKLAGRGRGQRRAKADSQSFTTSTPSVHSVG
jgi:short-subunit dehydrogenase